MDRIVTETPRKAEPSGDEGVELARGNCRLIGLAIYLGLLIVVFFRPLTLLIGYAATHSSDSHILLIPFISVYLIAIRRHELLSVYKSSFVWAIVCMGFGGLSIWAAQSLRLARGLSQNDLLSLSSFALICFAYAGGFLFLGRKCMAAAAFPVLFLLFAIPIPDMAVDWLENASKWASADAADLFFNLTGTPVLRDGVVFLLPGITIEVAKECSGIHSSLILFITSLVACQMFLKNPWHRAFLIAFVIPLGILRNGFRILTIGLLCVHVGPYMIDSPIHHHGGPLLFLLSLVPLYLFLWYLRRSELKQGTLQA